MRFDKFNNFFRIHAASLRKPGTSASLQVIGIRNFFEYLCGIKVHILVRGYDYMNIVICLCHEDDRLFVILRYIFFDIRF